MEPVTEALIPKMNLKLTQTPLSAADFDALTAGRLQLHPGFYPQWGRIVEAGLRQKLYTITARSDDGGVLLGALPLVFMRSPLFGRHLISVPYVNVGGCVVSAGLDEAAREDVERALVDEAVKLADSLGVKYLELRNTHEMTHPSLTFERRGKVLMELKFPETSEELWKAIGPKVRNQIRKGEKAGLREEWGGKELLKEFYAVFAETMRNVGTPVYSRRLFDVMFDELGEKIEICLVKTQENRLASAAILVHGREITEVPSAGTLRWANAQCANMFLYWNLLKHSLEDRGSKIFDFGRSSVGGGTWHFKKQWGAEEVPVVWKYYVREGTMDDVRPDNSSYGLAIRVWKRLPVWVTRIIGPWIVRGIP